MKFGNSEKSTSDHLSFGRLGERLALAFIERRGYRIVATNFIAPIGYGLSGRRVTGEIDLIAYDETIVPFILCFLEVKTRSGVDVASPEAAVDLRKQRHLIRTARVYRRLMNVIEEPFRYDVVSVFSPPAGKPEIQLLRGFFSEERFARTGRWEDRV